MFTIIRIFLFFLLLRLTSLFFFILTTASSKIIDYSHSNYIPILDGDTIIWKEYGYLSHTTNLTVFHEITNEAENMMNIFPQTHMRKILELDTQHINLLLSTLGIHHRHARSINLLGTVLKVIAGTPDADDFENVRIIQKQLVDSNNRQIEINTKTQIQIDKLTDTVNAILTKTKREQIDTIKLFEILLARNRMILMELQNLILSVTLAKINVVNPIILDRDDIKLLMNNEQFTNISISDLMNVSSIKVMLSEQFLYFIIKYPKPEKICKKISVFPVPHFGKIIQLGNSNTVADCGNVTYSVMDCQPTLSSTYCRFLQSSSCAQQLVSGIHANCSTQRNNLDQVTEVDDGIIVINDSVADIREDSHEQRTINGTYLILFNNITTVNGSIYVNRNNIIKRKPGTPTFPLINIIDHKDSLSLPLLHEMNMKNLLYIDEIKKETETRPILSSCIVFFTIASFYIAVSVIKRWLRNRNKLKLKSEIETIIKKTEDGLHLSEGVVNTEQPNTSCRSV